VPHHLFNISNHPSRLGRMQSCTSGTTPGPGCQESAENSVLQSNISDDLEFHFSRDRTVASRSDTFNNRDCTFCRILRVRRLSIAQHIRHRNPTSEDNFLARGVHLATITATPSISGVPGRYLDVGLLGRVGGRMALFPSLVSSVSHGRLSRTIGSHSKAPSRSSVTPGCPSEPLRPDVVVPFINLRGTATDNLLGIRPMGDMCHTKRRRLLPSNGEYPTSHQRSLSRSAHRAVTSVPEHRLLRSQWAVRTLPGGCSILISYARRTFGANQDFRTDHVI